MIKLKKFFLNILLLFFIIVFLYSAYILLNENKEYTATKKEENLIQNEVITNEQEEIEIDFYKLKEINEDTIAWIKINDNFISYPVVQTVDNEYYLTHSFDKSKNKNGWVFMDYKNNPNLTDNNTVIYAHNTNNSLMFSKLKNIFEEKVNGDVNITLYTPNGVYKYVAVSIYLAEESDPTPISTTLTPDKIKVLKEISKIDFSNTVSVDDSFLTLSTCHNITDKRIILHAKKVQ